MDRIRQAGCGEGAADAARPRSHALLRVNRSSSTSLMDAIAILAANIANSAMGDRRSGIAV